MTPCACLLGWEHNCYSNFCSILTRQVWWVGASELYQQMLIQKSRIFFLLPNPRPLPTSCSMVCVLASTPQGTGCTKKCIASILAFTSHTMKLELDSVPLKELSTSFEDQILSLIYFWELHFCLAFISHVRGLWVFSVPLGIHEMLTLVPFCFSLCLMTFFIAQKLTIIISFPL